MKGSAKPISSPGRTEKFPPPLMRFLRSNAGSRSRGRTRASPMFMRKNKNNVGIETIQEPSSPKVTCIGQVRVRRSSKSAAHGGSKRRSSSTRKNQQKQKGPCWWIRKNIFCCNFRVTLDKPKSLIPVLNKWVRCFRFGYCGKRVETVDSSSRVESTQRVQSRVSTSSTTTESIENVGTNAKIETENEEVFVGSNSNPPKNALLLTRCRSAPYRSSSLASRFWGSPLNSSDTESEIPKNNLQELEEKPVLENPISPNGENGDLGSRKSHKSEEMQSSITGGSSTEEEYNGGAYVHPLLLTRCKSEPARTGERLNPRRSTEPNPQS